MLLGGIGVLFSALFINACLEISAGTRDSIDELKKKMSENRREAEKEIEKTKSRFEDINERLAKLRSIVYSITLKDAAEMLSKIIGINYQGICITNNELEIMKKCEQGLSSYSPSGWCTKDTHIATALGLLGGLPLGFFSYSVAIDCEYDEVKKQYEEQRCEYEKIKIQCARINSLSQACETAYEAIEKLQVICEQGIQAGKAIIDREGTDFNSYTKKEQYCITSLVNVVKLLRDIVLVDIADEDGNVTPQFKKYIEIDLGEYLP